ncbi:MAG: T9SS type A sorting domain-containing protein [Bacteroidota bacterium]
MKKFYVSALAMSAFFSVFGQKVPQSTIVTERPLATEATGSKGHYLPKGTPAVWSDNFSTASNWTIDNSGIAAAGYGWDIGATENSWFFTSVINSTSDGAFAEVNNGDATMGTQELDVVYTLTTAAPIDVNTLSGGANNYILEFLQYGALFNDAQQVYISTTGLDGSWILAGDNSTVEPLTANGGDPYANPTLKSINLSGILPGGTNSLWIRFQWTTGFPDFSTNPNVWITYGWMIDDVALYVAPADEFKLHEVYTHDIFNAWDYYQTPTLQTAPSTLGFYVSNEGGAVQTKSVNVEILNGATSVYTGSSDPVTLQPGESDTIWFATPFTASAVGTYTINATLPADADDTNNGGTENFEVTDYLYGHNHALGTSKLSFTDEEEIGIGNIYQINANQLLKGIDVAFAGGTGGTTAGIFIDVYVFEMASASVQDPANFDVVNFPYQVPSPAPTSNITTITLPTPVTLEADKLYYVMLRTFQTATERMAIKTSAKGDKDFSTVCYGPFGANDAVNNYVGWGASPCVKLNFNPVLGINEENANVAISEVYPNPASAETTVKYSLNNAEEVQVVVLDVTGKIVKTVANGLQNAGEHTVTFDASDLASGVYHVNIVSEASTVTKKFIKK